MRLKPTQDDIDRDTAAREQVVQLMQRRDLNVSELAALADVARPFLSRWLRKKTIASAAYAEKLLAVLKPKRPRSRPRGARAKSAK